MAGQRSFSPGTTVESAGRRRRSRFGWRPGLLAGTLLAATGFAAVASSAPAGAMGPPFLSHFDTATNIASTVPANGDVNPYGIVVVPQSMGRLVGGDTLVSNFNARSNLQGTGTTIVQISPGGQQSLFSQIDPHFLPGPCPGGVGLTTALTVLGNGDVVVGSLPVTDAGNGTPEAGCLIVLDSFGRPIETLSGYGINGPWDLASAQHGNIDELFVTNVLNGTVAANGHETHGGTVVRLDVTDQYGRPPVLLGATTIATGFAEELNSSSLVLGPTGDALGQNDVLYVADTINNRIAAVPDASYRSSPLPYGGFTLTSGGSLNAPLGLTIAPNGDIITVNGGNGNAVEMNVFGQQVDTVTIDPLNAGGDLFGLAIAPGGRGVLFVDDGDNTLKLWGSGV
jgi:hypothetical protein